MNIQQMMKQAQALQKQMQELQQSLEVIEVTGVAAGGAVKVTATCKGEFKKVEIDPSILKSANNEPIEELVQDLEDFIVLACNNAKQNGDARVQEEMNKIGLAPEMLQMPF
jgi:DNA-binding YbaB/EbfC family protein